MYTESLNQPDVWYKKKKICNLLFSSYTSRPSFYFKLLILSGSGKGPRHPTLHHDSLLARPDWWWAQFCDPDLPLYCSHWNSQIYLKTKWHLKPFSLSSEPAREVNFHLISGILIWTLLAKCFCQYGESGVQHYWTRFAHTLSVPIKSINHLSPFKN